MVRQDTIFALTSEGHQCRWPRANARTQFARCQKISIVVVVRYSRYNDYWYNAGGPSRLVFVHYTPPEHYEVSNVKERVSTVDATMRNANGDEWNSCAVAKNCESEDR